MNILHLSTSDRIGGAAIAAYRMMEGMNKNGLKSKMLVLTKTTDNPDVIPVENYKFKYYKYLLPFKSLLNNLIREILLFPVPPFSCGRSNVSGITSNPLIKEADVIYIHWAQTGLLSIKDISAIMDLGKPTVLFLHDMWDLTGGCHHSFNCEQWKSDCANCPLIRRSIAKRYSKRILAKKKLNWHKDNVCVVSPSNWLDGCVKESTVFKGMNSMVIPNMYNDAVFDVLDKQKARQLMGLPADKKLLLFGAVAGSDNPYKGWAYADKLMKRLKDRAELVVFGNVVSTDSYVIHPVGKLTDECALALLYNAVDVYISPTSAESFGQTLVESISCGTRVVAFNVGGVPDIIDHIQNGYLAESGNLDDFVKGVEWALSEIDMDERLKMHDAIKNRFSYKVVTETHRRLMMK